MQSKRDKIGNGFQPEEPGGKAELNCHPEQSYPRKDQWQCQYILKISGYDVAMTVERYSSKEAML